MKTGYNTNLAAEFHVMSVLHRLGADAGLTLGNKKAVDIAVIRGKGKAFTIDVKGLAGTTCWPVDNFRGGKPGHFLVLVCYRGRIDDPGEAPEVYVVPSQQIDELMYHAPRSGRRVIQLAEMRKRGSRYRDRWKLLMQ